MVQRREVADHVQQRAEALHDVEVAQSADLTHQFLRLMSERIIQEDAVTDALCLLVLEDAEHESVDELADQSLAPVFSHFLRLDI